MGFFSKKKDDTQKDVKVEKETLSKDVESVKDTKEVKSKNSAKVTQGIVLNVADLSWVLTSPRLSEKAMMATDRNVYVFNVSPRANKKQIAEAIKMKYDVVPEKIRVTKIARKAVRNPRTGIPGVKGGGKKAYVYLKEGDSINVV